MSLWHIQERHTHPHTEAEVSLGRVDVSWYVFDLCYTKE